MSNNHFHVLLIEDNAVEAQLLQEILAETGSPLEVAHVELMAEAEKLLRETAFHAVLLDLSLPDSRGLAGLQRVQAAAPQVPVVVFTGLDDEATGTEAIRKGAQDYLVKGQVDGRLLLRAIRYAVERKRSEEEIRTLNAELEQRVAERTAVARRRAQQLRALTAELTMAEQRERRRLAQILHDHLQQLLAAARMKIGALARRVQEDNVKALVAQLDELLGESLDASRSLTIELSPPILYDIGLASALDWLKRQMYDKHALAVEVEVAPQVEPLAEDKRVLLFNAVRELLFNVVKHGHTSCARVQVATAGDGHVRVVVSDEGSGFDPKRLQDLMHEGGFGLFSIRERVEWLDGSVTIATAPGQGTRVDIMLPR